ncbi:MerR family transcriptional regulator [Indiicoccus explosivorum]|uniref:MerR family transcriptional regulator n=1 Tax=Indiicoccus explosivorum TaxID=1917864 RepID=UPI000B44A61C|nr:MerR family transcriptional regulator [Indiicoccus explosivorum]
MNQQVRRTMPLLPISIVMELTGLSARQIRHYEDQQLISPARTAGNKRMFSLNDVDRLLEIKEYLEQGINLAGIRKILDMQAQPPLAAGEPKQMTEEDLREYLRMEMMNSHGHRSSVRQGDLSRFYN